VTVVRLAFALLLLVVAGPVFAQETMQPVTVPSLDGTKLTGYFYPSAAKGPSPAVVFLHGCGGMLKKEGGADGRTTAWAQHLVAQGYAVLAIDSFTARGIVSMCKPADSDGAIHKARDGDAYGALAWLRARPDIARGRLGVIGWSQGGGVVLRAIATRKRPREHEFGAAIAFYPAGCSADERGPRWRTTVPLQVLMGDADVWTRAAPCQAFIDRAAAAGSPASIHLYPGAYHDFDRTGKPVHPVPAYRTKDGRIPIEGIDPEAMADAYQRVPAFLAARLGQ
jgi:dienelactone hydrolase